MIFSIVNFHYFGDESRYKQGIFPVSNGRFSSQLDLLSRHFSFISQSDLIGAIEGKHKLPENSSLITFDDGLRCQYEIALPILEQKGIPAIFFVSSLPYLEQKTLLVHKTHYVLANYSVKEIVQLIDKFIKKNGFGESFAKIIERIKDVAQKKYRYDESVIASVKLALNTDYIFNTAVREKIVSELFEFLEKDEKKFTDQLYLSKEMIGDLFKLRMLGSHTHSHQSLAFLSEIQIEKDLRINKVFLEDLVGGKIDSISFPYGGKLDIDSKVIEVCKKIGFKIGFTMERAFNTALSEPLMFARLDTNDVVGGRNPLFEFKGDFLQIMHGMTDKRTLFFKE